MGAEDLKEMGVALGHIKTLVAASVMAPFMNRRVRVQSLHYESFLVSKKVKEHGDDGRRCILQHTKKGDEIWLVEPLGNGTFRLKHEPTGSWLRMEKVEKEADTRSPWTDNVSTRTLQLVHEKKGVYYI